MANSNTLHLSGLSAVNLSSTPTSRELPTDPLDIFGAITSLIEQGLNPEDLENIPDLNQEVPESSLGAGAVEAVENVYNPRDGDTSTVELNLDELEHAIEQQGRQLEVRILSPFSLKNDLGMYGTLCTIVSGLHHLFFLC